MNWLNISHPLLNIIDVLVVAFVFYLLFKLIRGTRTVQILKGLALLIIASFLAQWFRLGTLSWILERFWTIGLVAVVVLFQPELRRALAQIGQERSWKGLLKREERLIDELVRGITLLSLEKTGAIIAIERNIRLRSYIESGIKIDSLVSSEILNTIFRPTTPLHDGAVIIKGGRIAAAGCILPLTHQIDLDPTFGTRHRSAIGLSEETDAVVIVVSEETGKVSMAINGGMATNLSMERLTEMLTLYLPKRGETFEIENSMEENLASGH